MTEDQEPEHKHKHKHSLPPAYVLLVETAGVGGLARISHTTDGFCGA